MSEDFSNVYDDATRAAAYSRLQYPGTYALAFRDLPEILGAEIRGRAAVDFGCGAGRSTRFLKELSFDAVGLDISEAMIERARRIDPQGEYRLTEEGGLGGLEPGQFDLVLSAFTFDNVPTLERKVTVLRSIGSLLKPTGRLVNLVSAPEIYVNEWASFSTRDFPENRTARSGDQVQIVMLDVEDRRPVVDVMTSEADYLVAYQRAGLEAVKIFRPLGRPSDGQAWVSEESIAPWTIYLLAKSRG